MAKVEVRQWYKFELSIRSINLLLFPLFPVYIAINFKAIDFKKDLRRHLTKVKLFTPADAAKSVVQLEKL